MLSNYSRILAVVRVSRVTNRTCLASTIMLLLLLVSLLWCGDARTDIELCMLALEACKYPIQVSKAISDIAIARMVALDLQPCSTVDDISFRPLLHVTKSRYDIQSRNDFSFFLSTHIHKQ